MKAIVYTSETGHTEHFAKLLSHEIGIPAYELKQAGASLKKGDEVIYLGWLMAGNVKGYKKAAEQYRIAAIGAVGMYNTVAQLEDIKKNNKLPASMPVFPLDGGFEIEKLSGLYKFMMNCMKKGVSKKLESKEELTPDEVVTLKMMKEGGSLVSANQLDEFKSWAKVC